MEDGSLTVVWLGPLPLRPLLRIRLRILLCLWLWFWLRRLFGLFHGLLLQLGHRLGIDRVICLLSLMASVSLHVIHSSICCLQRISINLMVTPLPFHLFTKKCLWFLVFVWVFGLFLFSNPAPRTSEILLKEQRPGGLCQTSSLCTDWSRLCTGARIPHLRPAEVCYVDDGKTYSGSVPRTALS